VSLVTGADTGCGALHNKVATIEIRRSDDIEMAMQSGISDAVAIARVTSSLASSAISYGPPVPQQPRDRRDWRAPQPNHHSQILPERHLGASASSGPDAGGDASIDPSSV